MGDGLPDACVRHHGAGGQRVHSIHRQQLGRAAGHHAVPARTRVRDVHHPRHLKSSSLPHNSSAKPLRPPQPRQPPTRSAADAAIAVPTAAP